ncbi:MAG: DUF924 domain-containing protein [Roseicyclus sp.]|nr:DUF924 domain-containing protein [Roseicyclus sp.]
MTDAGAVLAFWDAAGPAKWYSQDDEFDQAIRDQFGATWQAADDGTLEDWAVDARGALGLVILLDQFPRNMFRDDPRAFATDARGLEVSRKMLANGWDLEIPVPARQFAYLPFMHSEAMADQDLCCDLMDTRMESGTNDLHAHTHREIIARFGRFPYRNGPLEREMTAEEQAFIDEGGYAAILRVLAAEIEAQ